MERRLTAILSADVVGYSRLMGANEIATLEALKRLRSELLDPCIAEHHGRTFKLTGDGTLVEFPSVVSALECAIEIQRDMRKRNEVSSDDRKIEFRIGINLGDVIVDGDDLYGDGVNVASRIESVARPGGIAVSASVRDNVVTKTDVVFEDAGDQQLKNIEVPIRVYNVVIGSAKSRAEPAKDAVVEEQEVRPSIAVLPFNNMSGDPEQEYFSDGISEDIITDLSKVSGLFVIGRNTSFAYKGQSPDLTKVGSELGVRYILEGSVRKAGQRVRINAQLIDATTGGHVWADRYDRDLTDIFEIQDEITEAIVEQLRITLLPKEKQAITQAQTSNVEAYNYFLKGRHFFANHTKVLLRLARQMFVRATELDPGYARAYAAIAVCDARLAYSYRVDIKVDDILALAEKAIVLDPAVAEAYVARGVALAGTGKHAEAKASYERAILLDPASFDAHFAYGRYLIAVGKLEKAIPHLLRAAELDPDDWQSPLVLDSVFMKLGQKEEADRYSLLGVKRAEEAMRNHPENSRPAQLGAAALARLGETERAREWLDRALVLDPDDPIVSYNAACTFAQLGDVDRAIESLERWSASSAWETENWLQTDNDFDSIRSDPRFVALLEKVNQRGRVNA
ncbi:tetratricopeptide repeat protein [Sphingomonas sp. HDW15A]|uniref:adenylate/guanylate cyclase domain-containing protein n=1 Tax=Sphingomonas sp. HDW15A TaxID=2714942 RepID=UPI001407B014|nr:adenylate/guanylate cyclase domain-containing protein [Sphingomonas sp. HDW15A]QIK96846.1 tetratricopeptide repeat protein [Sphingomonas sp. HDW15A]